MESRVASFQSIVHPEVAFILYFPFQFYFYKNIYAALGPRAEFVIDLCHDLSPEEDDLLRDDLIALVKTIGGRYRVLTKAQYRTRGAIAHFFQSTTCLVSTWEKGSVVHAETALLRKVRLAYGVAKELTMVRPSGLVYDVVLAHGPRDAANFGLLVPTVEVGVPKFDDWFNGTVSPLPEVIRDRLRANCKTILYAPTHSDLSSLDQMLPVLPPLAKTYNVIVRLHYATARAERLRWQHKLGDDLILVDDRSDILPQLAAADLVISDNSSTIFEAVLADVPVLVADFWTEEYLTETHAEPRAQFGGIQSALTYPESLEQVVKREGTIPTFRSTAVVADEIERVLSNDSVYAGHRQQLREMLFPHERGESGSRAAQAINTLLSRSLPLRRPIMAYALESFQRLHKSMTFRQERSLRREVEELRLATAQSEVLPMIDLVLPLFNFEASAQGKELIKILCTQTYPRSKYRLTLVSHNFLAIDGWLNELGQLIPLPTIRRVEITTQDSWAEVTRVIQAGQSPYVAWINAETTLTEQWLQTCVGWLQRGGVKLVHGQMSDGALGSRVIVHHDPVTALVRPWGWWCAGTGLYNRSVTMSDIPVTAFYKLIQTAGREGEIVTWCEAPYHGAAVNYFMIGSLWAPRPGAAVTTGLRQIYRNVGIYGALCALAGYVWVRLAAWQRAQVR